MSQPISPRKVSASGDEGTPFAVTMIVSASGCWPVLWAGTWSNFLPVEGRNRPAAGIEKINDWTYTLLISAPYFCPMAESGDPLGLLSCSGIFYLKSDSHNSEVSPNRLFYLSSAMPGISVLYAFPVVILVASVVYERLKCWKRNRSFPLPPGPKGLPIVGNVLDIPRGIPLWEGTLALSRRYS